MTEYALHLTIYALLFVSGWKCCRWWHARQPVVPTPEQRALIIRDMARYRADRALNILKQRSN